MPSPFALLLLSAGFGAAPGAALQSSAPFSDKVPELCHQHLVQRERGPRVPRKENQWLGAITWRDASYDARRAAHGR